MSDDTFRSSKSTCDDVHKRRIDDDVREALRRPVG